MSKLKEVHSPESGVIVKTAKDGCAEGLVYGGGGKDGIFIKDVVPESPASKSLQLKQGDQILSATVYFENVSYEDAIQILEHAQGYKMKLCLKRKPDIVETEPTIESDVIPEDDANVPEMREQGKTKRRGDARISWPKFPSFGKGRKSRFTRSHSSSEADEQRKLELSPTTSDTESPIKSQDALKGKKRHKMKLPTLTKRGRISSSEEQDTDMPTTEQISSAHIHHTQESSDLMSPEGFESPTHDIYVTEEQRKVDDQESNEKHKVELICIDSTLKTADLTVALADQETPSATTSPDGKKKKKERSDLKIKILGKDKSHKQKAKSSPKRLKTMGASFDATDQQGKTDQPATDASPQKAQMELHVPKVELDVPLICKTTQKGEEKTLKGKEQKAGFKLPKVSLGDMVTEESIQKMSVSVGEAETKIEQNTQVKDDPYDRLSKSNLSKTQLPKREDIEIPGMEDVSQRTTGKGIKEPKAPLASFSEEIQAETVQLLIDVDSVKEAVSKLPGYKLPKVDTSGMPIPEEITVIDANAQRISVKTPTKLVDTKTKHDTVLTKSDVTVFPEISKTTVKLPKTEPSDLTSEELIIETKVHVKRPDTDKTTAEYELGASPKELDKKSRRAKITMPSFGVEKPDIRIPEFGIDLPKLDLKGDKVQGQRTIFLQEVKMSKTEVWKGKEPSDGVSSEVKVPDIKGEMEVPSDDMKYIDSASASPSKIGVTIGLPSFGIHVDEQTKLPKSGKVSTEISANVPNLDSDINIDGTQIKSPEKGSKFKMPNIGISIPKVKGPKSDLSLSKKDAEVILPDAHAGVKLPEVTDGYVNVSSPEQTVVVKQPEFEIKSLQMEGDHDGQGSKFKMPKFGIKMPKMKGPEFDVSLSKKNVDVTLPEVGAEVKLPEAPEVDITPGDLDASVPQQKIEIQKPELEMKSLHTEGELEVQGGKFKMPKLGIKMPKIKGPEFDASLPKKNVNVTLPEAKAEIKLPEAPDVDVTLGKVDVSIPEAKMEVEKPEVEIKPLQTDIELEGQGSKFKMPKFGIKMPKMKGPEFDVSLSKKDVDVTLPEAKAEVELPDIPTTDISLGNIDISAPEQKVAVKTEVEGEFDGQGGKFKMPKLGITMPKVKGPEIDLSLSKKDVEATLPEVKAEVKMPEPAAKVDIKTPEIKGAVKDVEGSPLKFKMPTFKLPKFGASTPSVSVEVPDKDLQIKEAQLKTPKEGAKIEITAPRVEIEDPSLDVKTADADLDGKGSKFKMPKFGISMPKVKGPEIDLSLSKKEKDVKLPEAPGVDVNLGKVDVSVPEAKIKVEKPELEVKPLQTDVEVEGQGSKFKMPTFDVSMPTVKGPEFHLGLSKKDGDITLPEAKADVNVPDVELKEPKAEIKAPQIEVSSKVTEGSPSKFKLPSFSFSMPKVKGPEINLSKKDADITLPEPKAEVKLPEAPNVDVSLGKVEGLVPEATLDIKKPEVEIKPLETNVELEGQGGKFKLPKFGFSMPKVKGPDIDLSLSKKEIDVTVPDAKVEVQPPDTPKISVEMKPPEGEVQIDRNEGKFKMPKFGIKLPKVKGPEIDLSLSKKEKDVKLPEAPGVDVNLGKADISLPEAKIKLEKPELEVKPLQADIEAEGQGGKFKMPKFDVSMPTVKGPEFHLGFSKKDGDVTLPQVKADVNLPDVELKDPKAEIKAPQIEVSGKVTDGSPSKFKLPSFGFSMPKVKGPEINLSKKDADITLPEPKAEVKLPEVPRVDLSLGKAEVVVPETKLGIEKPDVETKPLETDVELEGQGSKFKLPKFGFSMPKVKGPEIDLSSSKKDGDVTLPEAKVDVNLPEVELKDHSAKVEVKAPEIEAQVSSMKGSPSKFKMPTFKLPKFGSTAANVSAEVPEMDTDINIDGADMHISVPQKDVDAPEVKGEVLEPVIEVKEPLSGVVIEHPEGVEIDAKLKKPRFSLPRFSFSKPSIKGPEVDISGPDGHVAHPEGKVEVKGGEMDMKLPEGDGEVDGQGGKFKMPKLGITMSKISGPEIDLSLSKKDVDVTLPESKAEVTLPDVELKGPEVEITAPQIKVATKDREESPSKFKMPTFKLPKFGVTAPSVTVDVPDASKDIKMDGADVKIPEEVLSVQIAPPSIQTDTPSVDIKMSGTELEGKRGKFKLPSLGFTASQMKAPDIDVNTTLPAATAEVQLPDVELKDTSAKVDIKAPGIEVQTSNVEGSPSKFKMPTFKLPKFGVTAPQVNVEVLDLDKDIKVNETDLNLLKKDVNVELPEVKAEVKLDSDIPEPSVDANLRKTSWTLPRFSFSKPSIKSPETDVNLKVDVALPEVKTDIPSPDIDVKESSEIAVEGQPTADIDIKLKKPRFSLPKISFSKQATKEAEVDANLPDVDVSLPEGKVEVKKPDVDTKMPEAELDAQGSKFKMPRFGISLPKVKGPEIDLSTTKKDVDVTIPEAKAEIPEAEVQTGNSEGSPLKFKMPTIKLPKLGATGPQVSIEGPDVDKNTKIKGAEVKVPKVEATIKAPSVETEGLSVDVETKGAEVSGSKFKMPRFGISMPKVKGPEIDLSVTTKDGNVKVPEAKAEVPQAEVETGSTAGSPLKFKMPTIKLPKLGVGVEAPDVDKEVKIEETKVKVPKGKASIKAPSIDTEDLSVNVETKGAEVSGSKFKMPRFGISMPKVKGPEIDVSVTTKDSSVKVPEAKAEVPQAEVETGSAEGSPLKFKMPTMKLPKLGVGVEAPDVDKEVKIEEAKVKLPKGEASVKVPSIDTEGQSVDVEKKGAEVSGSKFKMPRFSISMPKVKGPEIDLSVTTKDGNVKVPEAKPEVPQAEVETGSAEGSPLKFKMPTIKLPKLGVGVEVPDVDKEVKIEETKVKVPKGKASIKAPSIDTEDLSVNVETKGAEVSGSKFKMPRFGISMPKVKGPEIDVSVTTKDSSVKVPEAKAEVPQAEVETGSAEGSPLKFKMPTMKLPKLGVSVEAPDVDKEVKIEETKVKVPKGEASIKAPSIDTEGPSVNVETKAADVSGSKFKMPRFGISMPKVKGPEIDISVTTKDGKVPEAKAQVPEADAQTVNVEGSPSKIKMTGFGISIPKVKGPEIDLSVSKKDVNVPVPEANVEAKLPDVGIKDSEVSLPDVPTEVDAKMKRPSWTFPRFSFSKQGAKGPDASVNLEGEVTLPEIKAEVCPPDLEVKAPSVAVSVEGPSVAEPDKRKFSLPRFSFSKPSVKDPAVSGDVPAVDVSLPEVDVKVTQSEMKSPELETEHDGQGSKIKLPKFGIGLPKVKGPEIDFQASQKNVELTLPEVKAEVKLPEAEVQDASIEAKAPESDAKAKDVAGSPLKFKMPVFKMPKFGGATAGATVEENDTIKETDTDNLKLKISKDEGAMSITTPTLEAEGPTIDIKTTKDATVNIKGPSLEIKTDTSKAATPDSETPKDEAVGAGQGSPSKFKLPSFKMPKLGFSRAKSEEEQVPGTETKEDQDGEPKEETKSPKLTLTSFGEILKSIDVEFDVPKPEEESLEKQKEVHEPEDLKEKQPEAKEKETTQDTVKSPERTGWFKFPKFGLSSPTEAAKTSKKEESKSEKSPAGETGDEEISPTCSIQSSEAFADISSAMTSEHIGLSSSSPTKVTVKYSDPDAAMGLGEMHGNIITSTTRTELISVEPDLPEKITILSSGVSSSSEDTLKLDSGKIHMIKSNIQATPEAQHATILTALQIQAAEGIPLKSHEGASWTVTGSQSSKTTFTQKHLVKQTSSESKETVVITKQITRVLNTAEPISDATATSIQRLKDSVHVDKMKFFDGAEK
ncbi:neuroblast differentiation-associated protein AHNAK isoform X2 [Sphaeramia orbicularis]|nr:neuroblast differentiation-associated protein AHNAK-like isoform X2 [Sphaeramia orbicularis]